MRRMYQSDLVPLEDEGIKHMIMLNKKFINKVEREKKGDKNVISHMPVWEIVRG